MDSVDLGFLAACLWVLWLTTFANEKEQRSAVCVALLMLAAWGWTKPLKLMHVDFLPYSYLSDVVLASVVAMIWWSNRRPWLLALLMAISDRSVIHVVYNSPLWSGTEHNYRLLLNGMFAIELACAAWPGSKGGYEFLARSWRLYDRRRHRRLLPANRSHHSRSPFQK